MCARAANPVEGLGKLSTVALSELGKGGDSFTKENTPPWASIPAVHTQGGGWERQPEAAPSV